MIDDIKSDQDIKYVPMGSADEAVEGVESGRYYAAIIFEDGFTYDMHHYEEAIGDEQPKITYYTNIKKNAVASKLTDAASEKLLKDINSKYVEQMLTKYFSDTGDALGDIDAKDAADSALEQLIGTRDAIHDYNASIGQIMSAKGDVTNAEKKLDKGRKNGSSDVASAKKKIKQAKAAIEDVSGEIDKETGELKTAIDDLKKILEQLKKGPIDEQTKAELIEKALEATDRVLTLLQNLRAMLPDNPQTTAGRVAADTLDVMISQTEHIRTLLLS